MDSASSTWEASPLCGQGCGEHGELYIKSPIRYNSFGQSIGHSPHPSPLCETFKNYAPQKFLDFVRHNRGMGGLRTSGQRDQLIKRPLLFPHPLPPQLVDPPKRRNTI